jgi:hypothetical protein
MEFLMTATNIVKPREAQRFEEQGTLVLNKIKSKILRELRSRVIDGLDDAHSTSDLAGLMWLFQKQRRPWECPFNFHEHCA